MPLSNLLTRRTFVQALSSVTAFAGLTSVVSSTLVATTSFIPRASKACFAFVASRNDTIYVFSVAGNGEWTLVQTMGSSSPVSLVLSPDRRFLYAANSLDRFNHLPSGSVEAYGVNGLTGHLNLINRQALALFATRPTSIAVSPDGRSLAAATADGVYNLLPLNEDGSIGHVTASIKSIVTAPYSAEPKHAPRPSVHFNAEGMLFITDPGNDRLSSSLVTEDGRLSLRQHAVLTGTGLTHLVSHPQGDCFFVAGVLEPLIASFKDGSGRPSQPSSQLKLPNATGVTALAIHPSGSLLFAATFQGIYVVRITSSGGLELAGYHRRSLVWPAVFTMTSDGVHLFALDHRDSFVRFDIDVERAQLSHPLYRASIAAPVALAIKSS